MSKIKHDTIFFMENKNILIIENITFNFIY